MKQQISLDNYLDDEGFIDMPSILRDRKTSEMFPGLLFNIEEIRKKDFPQLESSGRIYFDSTATTQEPLSVIERMYEYRKTTMRGSNHSKNSLEARYAQGRFEEARQKLKDFFNANNYIAAFTSGTTDSSNFVATRFSFNKRDTLILTEMEHNSQILTARNFARKAGADISYVLIDSEEGRLDLNALRSVVSKRKKGKILLNLVHVSNVSGIINPVNEIRNILGDKGFIYLDMAQSAGHMPIDLDSLDVDFAGVSSHKMYGPMGIGGVFINKKSEKYINNNISGGSAIEAVSRWFTVASDSPERFEPGTQDLEGAIEWGFTIDYLSHIGMKNIEAHEKGLGQYFLNELQKIKGIEIYGPKEFKDRTAVITFNLGSFLRKNYDKVARELDSHGISVRDGCFCAHIYTSKLMGVPKLVHEARSGLMKIGLSKEVLKLPGAIRASFAFYNTINEAYTALHAIKEIKTNKFRGI